LGIARTTFYRWYDRYQTGGPEVLEDHSPKPSQVWNRIPDNIRNQIVDLASDFEKPNPAGSLRLPGRPQGPDRGFH